MRVPPLFFKESASVPTRTSGAGRGQREWENPKQAPHSAQSPPSSLSLNDTEIMT